MVVGESGVKLERSRTLERRMGARRGSREGGGCEEEKAVGMCARKGGMRSSMEGGGMRVIVFWWFGVKCIVLAVFLLCRGVLSWYPHRKLSF